MFKRKNKILFCWSLLCIIRSEFDPGYLPGSEEKGSFLKKERKEKIIYLKQIYIHICIGISIYLYLCLYLSICSFIALTFLPVKIDTI